MNKFVKSAEYATQVHNELFALITKELKQHISNPEIIPVNFTIRYEKIIDTEVTLKFSFIGSLNQKMSNAYKNKKPVVLNYAFKIFSSEELASGSFKVKIIS